MRQKLAGLLGLSLVGLVVIVPTTALSAVPQTLSWPADGAGDGQPAATPTAAASPYQDQDIRWDRFVFATGFVIALLCVGVYVAKKLGGGWPTGRGRRHLEVLEATHLGGKTRLFLIKVAGRVVLFAANAENVARICEFAESELPELDSNGKQGALNGFKALLKNFAGGQR